ncbi:protein of unknown function [Methylacidimicrobium sp. AP8]|nr:protein of unknown function [Methylacidimicrobium sp. AP8]
MAAMRLCSRASFSLALRLLDEPFLLRDRLLLVRLNRLRSDV